jgi:hypothetical protein
VLVAALAAGCTGSHVGNPSELTLALTGFDGSEPGALTLGSGVVVDEAWVVLDRVRLRTAEDCGRRDEATDVPAPLAAELVSGRMLPARPELAASATRYCRVELRFDDLDEGDLDGVPADLPGRSILVRGARADGVAFELSTDAKDPFRLDAEDEPFALPEGATGLLVGFAMDEWLDAAALDGAEVGTRDGAPFITIDDRDNGALHDTFRAAVRESARLFRDENRDGQLNASERALVLGLGVPE